jgi:hypothetical protein
MRDVRDKNECVWHEGHERQSMHVSQAREGALEDVFGELRLLYDLIFEHGMPVSSMEQASFATAIPDWSHLHSVLDDVESSHQEKVTNFNGELVEGGSTIPPNPTQGVWEKRRNFKSCAPILGHGDLT